MLSDLKKVKSHTMSPWHPILKNRHNENAFGRCEKFETLKTSTSEVYSIATWNNPNSWVLCLTLKILRVMMILWPH